MSFFDSKVFGNKVNDYSYYDNKYFCESKHSRRKKSDAKNDFFDWLDIITVALVIVVFVFSFFFRVATIEGESMLNTFHDGERVIISDIFLRPKYGDVVVISRNYSNEQDKNDHDSQPIIKRVIATEGMTVRIDFDNGDVYVNEQKLEEYYTATPTNNTVDTNNSELLKAGVVVPKNCVFVLGDNRNNSLDSRSSQIGGYGTGMINKKNIIGKVYFRIFPFSKIGKIR